MQMGSVLLFHLFARILLPQANLTFQLPCADGTYSTGGAADTSLSTLFCPRSSPPSALGSLNPKDSVALAIIALMGQRPPLQLTISLVGCVAVDM
jgi:hypothetical protein